MPTIKTQFGTINLAEPDPLKIREQEIEVMLKMAQLQALRAQPGQQAAEFNQRERQLTNDADIRRAGLSQEEKQFLASNDLAKKNQELEGKYKGSLMENLVAERGLKSEDQNIARRGQDLGFTERLVGNLVQSGTDSNVIADVLASKGDPSYKSALATANTPKVDPITEALRSKLGGNTAAVPVEPPDARRLPNVMDILKGGSLPPAPVAAPIAPQVMTKPTSKAENFEIDPNSPLAQFLALFDRSKTGATQSKRTASR